LHLKDRFLSMLSVNQSKNIWKASLGSSGYS
jgi:hypothetical protein